VANGLPQEADIDVPPRALFRTNAGARQHLHDKRIDMMCDLHVGPTTAAPTHAGAARLPRS
jgi:hypothetical protein